MLDFEQLNLLFSGRRVSDSGIAGSEIDADDVRLLHCFQFAAPLRTSNSTFQRAVPSCRMASSSSV
ncbi:MAG TPA: hypothetical protein VN259_00465, partial [Xanthomonadales bacterium]|nr:hypothetical protein [Xanthomonadales bacterium]